MGNREEEEKGGYGTSGSKMLAHNYPGFRISFDNVIYPYG